MNHLINLQELPKLGRPIGKVEPEKLEAYISETEQLYIKPTLGTKLFLSLLADPASDARYNVLLEGGIYEAGKEVRSVVGLKTTIAYFVYAQNVMSGDFQSTRTGMVFKENDYSSRISSKERSDHYNNTLEVANAYLKECVDYCKSVGLIQRGGAPSAMFGGIRIRKIGN